MKEKSGQKTAIVVGMLVKPPILPLIRSEADKTSYQALALVE